MPRSSAIAAAFRTIFRRPAIILGEIAWRWAWGAAAWGLLLFTFFVYLHSLTISNGDWLLLRSRVPLLMSDAIRHILSGSGPRLLRAAAVLLPAFTVLWMVAASLGRWASLRALFDDPRGRFGAVLGLHFLRAAGALAAWIGYLGALLAAAFVASRDAQDHPAFFPLVFFVLTAVIGFFHGRLRWYLFLANILAVRDGSDAFAAIAVAFDAYRRKRGRFLGLAAAMGGIRLGLLFAVSVVSLAPVAMLPQSAWKPLLLLLVLITLAYCVVADFLFVVRLAAYIEILRDEPEPVPVVGTPTVPQPVPSVVGEEPSPVDRGPSTQLGASS